ncbi:MAG: Ig-like domain-containing protein [Rudaea sp.]|nr:Ig-like domain-containing protein [Rudaea sp.]
MRSSISDAAVLSGGSSPTGTITFNAFGPNNVTCTGTPVFTSVVSVAGNGTYTSGSFTPTQTGTYNFVASYGGDLNNLATTDACGAANESVIVVQATTTTALSTACETTFVENQPFTLVATVTGVNPSGTVTFSNLSNVLCASISLTAGSASCITSTLATSGSDTQDQYPLPASYSGDANNLTSTSSPLNVNVLSAGDVIFRNGYETESASCPIE